MLRRLRVRNLAIVEEAVLDFDPALTVITGETGAGKSVLMGALELVLGGRADATVVRDGAKEAEVEADFGDRVVRRTVTREGRSRAWIDDESVSIGELREFGRHRVDVHGPAAAMKLSEGDFQREVVDADPAVAAAQSAYARRWREYSKVLGEIASLSGAGGEDEAELLRFHVGELEDAGLTDADETVAERHAAAAHAEEIVENANAVTEALGGDQSVAEILAAVQPRLRAIARHLPQAEAWEQETADIAVRAQELSRSIADAVSGMDCGAEDLDALDARLTLVNRLKRKFRAETVSELLGVLEEKKARLAAIEGRDERLAELCAERTAAEKAVGAAGARLTKARKTAAAILAKAVSGELKDLGFRQAGFSVEISPQEPDATGCDRVVYMFAPNPGEPARPLADIASSGETARVMLALTAATASRATPSGETATLVFDEIDANVGGEAGRVVGEKLRAVSMRHQVVAITHLPQSAVYGLRHLVVSKRVADGRTRTHISPAEGEARVAEIARMLGGEGLTSVVRKHAQELLSISR